MATEKPLSDKMRELARDRLIDGPASAERLIQRAQEFDEATQAHYGPNGNGDTAKKMLGAWARARRLYADTTGEPLL